MPVYGGYAGRLKSASGRLLIIDDETEMPASICTLIPFLLKGDELIT
jgi:hypothetical protein